MFKQGGLIFDHFFPIVIDPVFANLLRNDGFYSNPDCTKYSFIKIDESYLRFTEGVMKRYPGYGIDSNYLVCNKEDIDIDLDELKKIFLSKDMDLYDEIKDKYFTKEARFLNTKSLSKITYTSYPRSGNTFLRKYFESITGLATGSDQVMKFNLNVVL